jgi:hypothetical protein
MPRSSGRRSNCSPVSYPSERAFHAQSEADRGEANRQSPSFYGWVDEFRDQARTCDIGVVLLSSLLWLWCTPALHCVPCLYVQSIFQGLLSSMVSWLSGCSLCLLVLLLDQPLDSDLASVQRSCGNHRRVFCAVRLFFSVLCLVTSSADLAVA